MIKKLSSWAEDASFRGTWDIPLLMAIVFYFSVRPYLVQSSLDIDEMISWEWLTLSWDGLLSIILADSQGLAFFSILKVIDGVFPLSNDYWLRLPSLALGFATVVLWGSFWQRRYAGYPIVVLVLAALLMFNPLVQFIFSYAGPYALAFLILSWLLIKIMRAADEKGPGSVSVSWWDVLLVGILFNTHHLAVIWLAGVVTCLIVFRVPLHWGSALPKFAKWAVIGGFATLAASVIGAQLIRGESLAWSQSFAHHPVAFVTMIFSHGSIVWPAFFLLGLLLRQLRLDFSTRFALGVLAFGLLGYAVMSALGVNLFLFRYMSYAIPFALILQGETVKWVVSSRWIYRTAAVLVLIGHQLLPDFRAYAQGIRQGPKQILQQLKVVGGDLTTAEVDCHIFTPAVGEGVMAKYSRMYYEVDVCSRYLNRASEIDWEKSDYVIHLKRPRAAGEPSKPGLELPVGWSASVPGQPAQSENEWTLFIKDRKLD
jgi:hypothetical protein